MSFEAFLPPDGSQKLLAQILTRMEETARQLSSQPKFSEVARQLGAISQMVLLLNLPDSARKDSRELASWLESIRWNVSLFRLVAYEGPDIAPGSQAAVDFLQEVQNRAARLSARFQQPLTPATPAAVVAPLDPKSPLFGVVSLVYSHSVNDLARIWLWIWQSANGDMSDRPEMGQRRVGTSGSVPGRIN